jgi:hypothetical protein
MTSTHLAMDYREIDTAADILAAFKGCANAGEEIQLFESLAEREHPPVGEFVTILKEIKLETALALAIQAFGKIKDDEIKAGLKVSGDLLALLCEQAKSGATDLIRWSAATTIEKIGFDFIAVSRHLTEEPEVIIQRIVQSKVKVLTDAERNRHGIKENNDYDSLIRFWVYGATYELRSATVNSGGGNAVIVVNAVVKAQDVWGIKQTSFLFLALENHARISLNQAEQRIYENQLFERECQLLASQLLVQHQSSTKIEILVSNQIHCLQSNIESVRKYAALILLSLDSRILDVLKQHNSALSSMIAIFSKDSFGEGDNFCYQEVAEAIRCSEIADQYLDRYGASKHCQDLHEKLLCFVKNRKENIAKKFKTIDSSKKYIVDTLNNLRIFHPEVYDDYSDFDFGKLPEVDIENDKWQVILDDYYERITAVKTRLDKSIKESDAKQERLKKEKKIQEETNRRDRQEEENRVRYEENKRQDRIRQEKDRTRQEKDRIRQIEECNTIISTIESERWKVNITNMTITIILVLCLFSPVYAVFFTPNVSDYTRGIIVISTILASITSWIFFSLSYNSSHGSYLFNAHNYRKEEEESIKKRKNLLLQQRI